MVKKKLFLAFPLFLLLTFSYALEIEINWGYHGFLLEIAPTNTSLIHVLTGNITPTPHCVGQCSPMEDEATFYEYYYYINGSGSFLVSSCLFISSLYSPPDIPEDMKKLTQVVYGEVNGSSLIFSKGDRTYKIPVLNITPYLWDSNMSEYMVGYFLYDGIVFFPEIKVSAFEIPSGYDVENYTESIFLRINGTYNLTLYRKGEDEYGIPCWKEFKTIQLSEYNLESLLKKPIYVFFYDGKKLKVFPIMRVRMELNVREKYHKVEAHTLYTFQNMAEKLKLRNNKTSRLSDTFSSIPPKNTVTCGVGTLVVLSLLPLALRKK